MNPSHWFLLSAAVSLANAVNAQEARGVYLEEANGLRIKIAQLTENDDGAYRVDMETAPFNDHFLSMRPFKCLQGPSTHWCHVPYPYENIRNISFDTTDLEYDFLFVWKDAGEYGINMWNGVYYKIVRDGDRLVGTLHEMDMGLLAVPPEHGELRPIKNIHLQEVDTDSHWLPRLMIE